MISDNDIAILEAKGYKVLDVMPNGAVRTNKGTLSALEVEDILEEE